MIVKADDYNSRTHTECDTITAFKREAYEITIHALIRSAIWYYSQRERSRRHYNSRTHTECDRSYEL